MTKFAKWNDHTKNLRDRGYTSCGSLNDPNFVKPQADDWEVFYYGESCMTIYSSKSLKVYTTLDSGD